MFIRRTDMQLKALTTSWESLELGKGTHLVIQADAAIRITWGDTDANYFTYAEMTEPIIVPAGCRIRAETTANLRYMAGSYA